MSEKNNGISLTGSDIMPTKNDERKISNLGFMILWIGMAVQLNSFIVAAQLYPGLSPTEILIACIIGNLFVGILLWLIGAIGVKYGITFSVIIRTSFGYMGTHIPSLIRALPAIFLFGFQTWLGSYALNTIMEVLTGYSNLYLLLIIFGAVQIVNASYGIGAIQFLEWIAAPTILLIGVYMEIKLLLQYDLTLGGLLSIEGNGTRTLGYGIVVMMGNYITMVLNASDFTRFLKVKDRKASWWKQNFGSLWSQNIGLISSMLILTVIGLTSGVATGNWNPVDVMIEVFGSGNPLILIGCLAFVILAQWSSNISANLLPPAYIIVNFWPKKINFSKGIVISGVIGLIMLPWKYGDIMSVIFTGFTALLLPIVGIMISDYYFLRKRKINMDDLYNINGQYKYWKNINPAALIAYIPASVVTFIYTDYGFIGAFIISGGLYYVLMKYWIGKVYYQPEIYETKELKKNIS